MQKRISPLLPLLVIVLLSCSRLAQIANAEESIIRPGTSYLECKVLEKTNTSYLTIKVTRDLNTLCAREVLICKDLGCVDCGDPIKGYTHEKDGEKYPVEAFSSSGNQFCSEAFVKYVKSPYCFRYTTGGTTYFIPPT